MWQKPEIPHFLFPLCVVYVSHFFLPPSIPSPTSSAYHPPPPNPICTSTILVPEEEPTGDLICPSASEGQEPVLELIVVLPAWLVNQKLEVMQEELVVESKAQSRRMIFAEI
jgi:hypothetical protein